MYVMKRWMRVNHGCQCKCVWFWTKWMFFSLLDIHFVVFPLIILNVCACLLYIHFVTFRLSNLTDIV